MSCTIRLSAKIRTLVVRDIKLTQGGFAEPYQFISSAVSPFPVTVYTSVSRFACDDVYVLPALVIVKVVAPTPRVMDTV